MTTDDTARAILDLPDDVIIDLSVPTHSTFPQYEGHSQSLDVKIESVELQRMARLWLMRDEILQRLAIGRVPAADYIVNLDGAPTSDLYARIRDIDKLASLESE